ncbi:MAG: NAD(P)H-hydrate epimerase, partial [Nocardioides sp.]
MRLAHTVADVRRAEAALLAQLPEGVLMQRAAAGLATAVGEFLGGVYGARVLLLIGSGDNGGDALWAGARLLQRGALAAAVLLAPDRAHEAGLAAFRAAGGRVVAAESLADEIARRRPDVVLDGMVGIGGSGPLRPDAAAAASACAGLPMVAVDLPSGIEPDTGQIAGPHVVADLTVTFGTHKPAHFIDPGALACGAVELVDIGLTLPEPVVRVLTPADVAELLPRPAPAAHKYTRGVVGVRTGSELYPGAGVLSVAGASCGLAGMVRYLPV